MLILPYFADEDLQKKNININKKKNMKRFYLLPIVCCALSISLSAQENNGTATTSGADDNRILSADSLLRPMPVWTVFIRPCRK